MIRGRLLTAICLTAIMAATSTAQGQSMELSPNWEYVADTVMGGVSSGTLRTETVKNRDASRLQGKVSLDNNGGFVQMAFDLRPDGGPVDASAWTGVEFEVYGNNERYDLRLRTDQLSRPWQSFRAEFSAPDAWTTIRVPFANLDANNTSEAFDPTRLRHIGILAVGRVFQADIAVSNIRLYQ